MSAVGEGDYEVSRPGRRTLVGGAAVVLLSGLAAGAVSPLYGVAAGVAAAACLAAFAWRASPPRDVRAVDPPADLSMFDGLLAEASQPMALTDADGAVLSRNRAFAAAFGGPPGVAAARTISSALSAAADDPHAVTYRLATRAMRRGAAFEDLATGGAAQARLRAVRIGDNRLLWVAEQLEDAGEGHRQAPYAFATFSAAGGVLDQNAAFAALDEADREALRNAAAKARAAGRLHGAATLKDGREVTLAIHPRTRDAADVFALEAPVRADADAADALDDLPVAVARLSEAGRILAVNAAARALIGPRAAEGAALTDLLEGLGRPIAARLEECAGGRGMGRAELARGVGRDHETYVQIALKRVERDGEASIVAVLSDATELKTLEQQFVQSQKMQAVGQLAGGVAHDFNNLLTAILGHCDLLALRREEDDPDFEDLSQIRQNANRAASLVRQLLAFSRQQKLNPKACALTDTLSDLSHLLNRLISERVTLRVDFDDELWPVWIDEQQFEQVILNLVVNARDAMPNGGEISILCANRTVEAEIRRDRAVVPIGDYVSIRVADRGMGMNEDIRAKAFEPFFTTKTVGEGTGLGLSTVYGIVKQTGGFIFIDTAPGKGSTFEILIPRLREAPASVARAAPTPVDLTGAGVVLLVEDETPVRVFAARALKMRGYTPLEAEDADAALAVLEERDGEVDLVVSDVVMPGRDGPTWVREARKRHPDLPVIFTSGYDEDVFRKGGAEFENCTFLPKPFTLDELALAVKQRIGDEPIKLEAPNREPAPPASP